MPLALSKLSRHNAATWKSSLRHPEIPFTTATALLRGLDDINWFNVKENKEVPKGWVVVSGEDIQSAYAEARQTVGYDNTGTLRYAVHLSTVSASSILRLREDQLSIPEQTFIKAKELATKALIARGVERNGAQYIARELAIDIETESRILLKNGSAGGTDFRAASLYFGNVIEAVEMGYGPAGIGDFGRFYVYRAKA